MQKLPQRKNDPKLVAAARELRDRVCGNADALPAPGGKYHVVRQIEIAPRIEHHPKGILPAA